MSDQDHPGGGFGPTTTLQDALDLVGSPMNLVWKPHTPAAVVPVVPPEFVGWREELRASHEGVALLELSHHMADLFIEGPDAVRLLAAASANNYEKFAVGQAKQLITVTDEGWLIQDAIISRTAEDRFVVTGIGTAHNWVAHHARQGGYDVQLAFDPPSDLRGGADPVLFRIQVQGPSAPALLGTLFGDALDDIAFFHHREVTLDGLTFTALRHGMAGEPGFEFIGPYELHDDVHARLVEAGAAFGLVQVGGLAYYSSGVDSGWLATPLPAVYTSDGMADFRRSTSVYSYEGMAGVHGSFYSDDPRDYYVNPYEVGYGRSISFNHDFIGRDALLEKKDEVRRTKVTLVWDSDDVARVFGADGPLVLSYSKDRVEVGPDLVGISEYAASSPDDGTVHSIARVDTAHAAPGTEVVLVWGEHPGPGGEVDVSTFQRIRATVAPSPYTEYARTSYRDK